MFSPLVVAVAVLLLVVLCDCGGAFGEASSLFFGAKNGWVRHLICARLRNCRYR